MTYRIPTNWEEFTLIIKIKTDKPEKIKLIVKDEDEKNTVFTDRWKTVNGECTLYVRMPVSGKNALIEVYNEKNGNKPKGADDSFEVVSVEKVMLEKKMDVVDFTNPLIKSFIKFCTKFCFNAGHINSGNYISQDGKFNIEYLPIIKGKNGEELNTPARISKSSGRIQVSMKKIIPMTVPMRMAIMLHEFSHYYINDDISNEIEADLNGLLIYLGLGYPRIEAYEAFLKTFVGTPTEQNKIRYDKLNKFITDFEKNNFIVYEQ